MKKHLLIIVFYSVVLFASCSQDNYMSSISEINKNIIGVWTISDSEDFNLCGISDINLRTMGFNATTITSSWSQLPFGEGLLKMSYVVYEREKRYILDIGSIMFVEYASHIPGCSYEIIKLTKDELILKNSTSFRFVRVL